MAIGAAAGPHRVPAPGRVAGKCCAGVVGRLLPCLMLVCTAAAGAAEPTVWLEEMHRAFAELDYDGVFSYYTGGDVAALRIVHMVIDGERRERLVYLNGPHREIVRRGGSTVGILSPDDELAVLAGSIPSGPIARAYSGAFDRVSEHYEVSHTGVDRVAGRAADRISVAPRDGDRYGYRLWLDRENRLLLRSESIGTNGERLEFFRFASISLGADVRPESLEPAEADDRRTVRLEFGSAGPAQTPAPRLRWHAGWVPAGFTMAAAEVHETPSGPTPVDTMMYTDGLASFSVFVEDMAREVEVGAVLRHGATVAVSGRLRGPDGQRALVTLVGEVPVATARRIAASVAFGAPF